MMNKKHLHYYKGQNALKSVTLWTTIILYIIFLSLPYRKKEGKDKNNKES